MASKAMNRAKSRYGPNRNGLVKLRLGMVNKGSQPA